MLTVGIPREIKPQEKRIGLTPAGVFSLLEAGIPIIVEKEAGMESGFSDRQYQKAGARIVDTPAELYREAGVIQKVKEPLVPEWRFLKPGLILFSFLHLAAPENKALAEILVEKRVTALGFETGHKENRAVFLEPMSRIAGTLSAYYAGFFKQYARLENGQIVYPPRLSEKLITLASQYPLVPEIPFAGRAVIFGGGVVGENAARMLLEMNWTVEVVERRSERRLALQAQFQNQGSRFRVRSNEENVSESLQNSDVWLGSVHILGERAPWVVSAKDMPRLSQGRAKLIIDVAIDQGGNFPETHSTTYERPLYLDSYGNLRFAVPNIPSLAGRAASEALEKAILPYLIELGKRGESAIPKFEELQSALQVTQGRVVNEAVRRAMGIEA